MHELSAREFREYGMAADGEDVSRRAIVPQARIVNDRAVFIVLGVSHQLKFRIRTEECNNMGHLIRPGASLPWFVLYLGFKTTPLVTSEERRTTR